MLLPLTLYSQPGTGRSLSGQWINGWIDAAGRVLSTVASLVYYTGSCLFRHGATVGTTATKERTASCSAVALLLSTMTVLVPDIWIALVKDKGGHGPSGEEGEQEQLELRSSNEITLLIHSRCVVLPDCHSWQYSLSCNPTFRSTVRQPPHRIFLT